MDSSARIPRPAVFLDRDGTLNEERGYLSSPEMVNLIEGSAQAVARLRGAGFSPVVISNQSGVGRGLFTADDVDRVNKRLCDLLREMGAELEAVYYCPHAPSSEGREPSCSCRKPRPGLLERAVRDLNLDLNGSVMVGDSMVDVELGWVMSIPVVLVLTGFGRQTLRRLETEFPDRRPDHVAENLAGAVPWILRMEGRTGG